ncbi:MAG: hypothetical protein ACREON_18040, partial [Gemmatimonadaceae bacterium]
MSGSDSRGRSAERRYRLLLRAFPQEFRRELGDEMAATFREQWEAARASGRGGMRFWVGVATDAVVHGALERIAARSGGRRAVEATYREESTVETIVRCVRVTLRSLWRRPAFTGVAVLTMALGVGTTTAMFGVVNAVLLRPLPYPGPRAAGGDPRGACGAGTRGAGVGAHAARLARALAQLQRAGVVDPG